jgi:hypothetical protein
MFQIGIGGSDIKCDQTSNSTNFPDPSPAAPAFHGQIYIISLGLYGQGYGKYGFIIHGDTDIAVVKDNIFFAETGRCRCLGMAGKFHTFVVSGKYRIQIFTGIGLPNPLQTISS